MEMDFTDEKAEQTFCVEGADRHPDGYYDGVEWRYDESSGGYEIQAMPFWRCDACGLEDTEVYSFPYGDILLCSVCVLAAANRYHFRRAGRFLTWTNPRRRNPNARKPIPGKLRKKIFERDAYRCRYCGSHLDLVLDHVIPHVRTKDDREENLVTACQVCNSKKQDRTPEEAGMTLLFISICVVQAEAQNNVAEGLS